MGRNTLIPSLLSLVLVVACLEPSDDAPPDTSPDAFKVAARAETEASSGDPDDMAIWRDPSDPARSLIVTTDKSGGMVLYELDGTQRQDLRDGVMNNVDLRADVELGGQWGTAALIATSNRTVDSIDLYTIDPTTRLLVRLGGVPSDIGEPYGLCNYRSPVDGRVYVIVNNKQGAVAQYEVQLDQPGAPTLALVRSLMFDSQLEGCVADDELGRLYVGEELLGVWRVDAEPDADAEPTLIHDVSASYLSADVEGMTIYHAANEEGYLIVSSQGNNTYAMFERGGDNAYVTSFRITVGKVDAAVETDGIDVTNAPLGPLWPHGLFIVQDDHNEGYSRNFKLVDWADLVAAADVELVIDPEHGV